MTTNTKGDVCIVDKQSGNKYISNGLSLSSYNNTDKTIDFTETQSVVFTGTRITIGGSYTLECMVKASTLVYASVKFLLFNFDSMNNDAGSTFVLRKDKIVEASYRPFSGTTIPIQYTMTDTTGFIHLALVVDKNSNTFSYYVNGELVNSTAISIYANNAHAAAVNTSSNRNFRCSPSFNMIRQYDKALSAAEILGNYNYQKTLV